MTLPEIFLENLYSSDFSIDSIINALNYTNQVFEDRYYSHLFTPDKAEDLDELKSFWDVFREFEAPTRRARLLSCPTDYKIIQFSRFMLNSAVRPRCYTR